MDSLRPHLRARDEEPAQLIHRDQGPLHRRLWLDAQIRGVRRDRPDHLRRRVAALELGHDRPRMARDRIVHVREPLVVRVVQEAGHGPQLRVLAVARRIRLHSRGNGEAMAA